MCNLALQLGTFDPESIWAPYFSLSANVAPLGAPRIQHINPSVSSPFEVLS